MSDLSEKSTAAAQTEATEIEVKDLEVSESDADAVSGGVENPSTIGSATGGGGVRRP